MKLTEVRERAEQLGVKTGRKRKADLIRDIQTAEGNFACFGSAHDFCDQHRCRWREDCLGENV